jgi:sugar/nucleoside kinase (ribokinase family)
MRRTFLEGGAELERILASARAHGCAVSLDMSLPDQDSESGRADWRSILSRVLPLVDVFFPSEAEARFMLRSSSPVEELAGECVGMGAKAVVMKLGADGLLGLDSAGFVRQGCFRAEVVGTTGSGDATIAGFLYGRAQGWSFAECLRAGCAVGACSVEQADATSGIPSWGEIEARMSMGWGMLD